MHLYWRIQQDLSCIGEKLQLIDPALRRSFTRWLKKNAAGLAMAEDFSLGVLLRPCLN
jgi:hypothetical protein